MASHFILLCILPGSSAHCGLHPGETYTHPTPGLTSWLTHHHQHQQHQHQHQPTSTETTAINSYQLRLPGVKHSIELSGLNPGVKALSEELHSKI